MNFEKFSQTTAYFVGDSCGKKGSDIAEKKHNPRVICRFLGCFFFLAMITTFITRINNQRNHFILYIYIFLLKT